MALIKCHECGKEVSDSAASCPNCGFGVADKVKAELEQKEREERDKQEQAELKRLAEAEMVERELARLKKEQITQEKMVATRKRKRIIALISTPLIIAGTCIVIYIWSAERESRYNLGFQYLKGKEYEDAIKVFESLGNYKDSGQIALESTYTYAFNLITTKPIEAKAIFESIKHYKDSEQMVLECMYEYARSLIKSQPQEAKSIFEDIINYKDSSKLITKCDYSIACLEYKEGNLESAKEMFLRLADYEESAKYLSDIEVLIPFQGTWSGSIHDVIIKGPQVASVFRIDGGVNVYTFNCFVKDNTLQNGSNVNDMIYKIDEDGNLLEGEYLYDNDILVPWFKGEEYNTYVKKSDSTNVPKTKEPSRPKIGMTASQVRASSWGSPSDINSTTTKYGTREQWVYSGYRYVYFENGVVTSIQD